MFVKSAGTPERSRHIAMDMGKLRLELERDFEFLTAGAGAEDSNDDNRAIQGGRSSNQMLMELPWSTIGFEELVKKVRNFQAELRAFAQDDNSASRDIFHFQQEAYCCRSSVGVYDC